MCGASGPSAGPVQLECVLHAERKIHPRMALTGTGAPPLAKGRAVAGWEMLHLGNSAAEGKVDRGRDLWIVLFEISAPQRQL